MPDANDNFTPDDFTPEQAAAYANCTAVVVLSELLAMHWDNETVRLMNLDTLSLTRRQRARRGVDMVPLPHSGQMFQERARRQCVMHPELIALFRRAYKNQ